MNSANRRGFLKIAGAGAAAAGAASLTPSAVSMAATVTPATHRANPTAALPKAATGSMVAYVHDVAKGEIAVMVEGREVIVTDHELIAKLATAVHAASAASV